MMVYCFELQYVKRALAKCNRNDLAVVDTDGISMYEINYACARGVWVYGYINAI